MCFLTNNIACFKNKANKSLMAYAFIFKGKKPRLFLTSTNESTQTVALLQASPVFFSQKKRVPRNPADMRGV